MSRVHMTPHPDLRLEEVVVGVDHLLGWFIQVWNTGEDDPTVDRDMVSRGEMLKIIDLYTDPHCPVNRIIRDKIALDVDPG